MNIKITFVIGGARSGKSSFALNRAAKIEGRKAYLATAEALDDEMKERIHKHKRDRGNDWDTFEEPVNISSLISDIGDEYEVIVLDCLTLWLSNILIGIRGAETETRITEERINHFIAGLSSLNSSKNRSLFVVSNELGAGIVPDNELAREFRDLAGFLNQKVAEIADEVYLITAGIPLKIK
jgi:adenosylcobinamide kinase/adenosylcobinamide-phosphate guanylyltransferase